ncbi:MAG: hypothetical protein AMXMBFR34_52490 [Myxococcaceae bacterium]
MRTTISVEDRLLKRARREAEARGLTLSAYVCELVRRDLDQPKPKAVKPFKLITHDAKLAPGYDWYRLDEQTYPLPNVAEPLKPWPVEKDRDDDDA